MIHIGFFEGFGGFALAAKWKGWKTVATCEIEEFPRKILQYYWPNAYHHRDIHDLNYEILNEELTKKYGKNWRSEDIILTGGFPCQPYSQAGKRLGKADPRHLWPEMLRLIREIKPSYVLGENVRGIVNWSGGLVFEEVQTDLENQGYEVLSFVLPAASINAPHKRDRVWFVAYSKCIRSPRKKYWKKKSGFNTKEDQGCRWKNFPTQSPIRSGDDGFSSRLDDKAIRETTEKKLRNALSHWNNESIKGFGNAVVPQLVYEIYEVIEQMKNQGL